MAKKATRIPALNSLESIKEALDVRLGRRGDPLDRAITVRDLTDSGLPVKAVRRSSLTDFTVEYEDKPAKYIPTIPTGLVAYGQFGGINVVWDSTDDGHLISHTEVYRSTSPDPTTRQFLTAEGGMMFYDVIDDQDQTLYYYWARHVSTSGHFSGYAGPAEAASLPLVKDVMERITGEIDESVLATNLREEIARISGPESITGSVAQRLASARIAMTAVVDGKVSLERIERLTMGELLTRQITTAATDWTEKLADERTEWEAGFGEVDSQLTSLNAAYNDQAADISSLELVQSDAEAVSALRDSLAIVQSAGLDASIRTQEVVRIEQGESLAQRIDTVEASVETETGQRQAAITAEQTARANDRAALAQDITTVEAALNDEIGNRQAAFVAERNAWAEADTAVVSQIDTLAARVDDETTARQAAIRTEQLARADDFAALSSDIDTVQASVDNETTQRTAAIQQESTARADDLAAMGQRITMVQAMLDTADAGIDAKIIAEQTARVSELDAVASSLNALDTRIGDNEAMIVDERMARASDVSALTSAVTSLTARLDSTPVWSSDFETGSDFDRWTAVRGSVTTTTANPRSGAAAAFIRYDNASNPSSTGATHGTSAKITESIALSFAGQRVRVSGYARAPESAATAASEFAVAYSTAETGNSGWHRFPVTSSWAPFEFLYDVPSANNGDDDYVGIWGDTSNSNKGVVIDTLRIQLATTEEDLPAITAAIQTEAEARVTADNANTAALNTAKSQLNSAIAGVQSSQNTEVSRLDGLVTAASNKADVVRSELKGDVAGVRSDLSSAVSEMESGITAQSNKTDTVKSQLTSTINSTKNNLQGQINNVEDDMREGLNSLDNALVTGLAGAQSNLDSAVSTLDGKITAQSNKTDSVQSSLTSKINSEKSALQKQINDLDKDIDSAVATAKSDLNSEVSKLNGKITAQSSKTDGVEATLKSSINSTKNNLQGQINNLDDDIEEGLAQAQSNLNSQVNSLNGKITAQSKKTDTVKSQLTNTINSTKKGLADDISGVASDLTRGLATAKSDLNSEVSKLNGKISAQSSKTDTVQAQLGEQIAAVEVTQTVAMSGTFLSQNPVFAGGSLAGWTKNSTVSVVKSVSSGGPFEAQRTAPSEYIAKFQPHANNTYLYGQYVAVTEGDKYVIRFDYAGGGYDNVWMRLYLQFRDVDGNFISSPSVSGQAKDSQWRRTDTVVVTVPEKATKCRLMVRRDGADNRRTVFVTNVVAQRSDATLETLWSAKVQSNGLIGGFGLGTDGETVEAGFDVDRFWVGRTNDDKRKPFIIENGYVYMNKVMIAEGAIQEGQLGAITIGKLTDGNGAPITTVGGLIRADAIDVNNLSVQEAARFTGDVFSSNYVPGKSGWAMLQSGYVEFNEAMIRGNLEVQSITVNGESPFGAIRINDSNANLTGSNSGDKVHTRTLDGTYNLSKMAKGSRVNLTIYPRFSGSVGGSYGSGYWWENDETQHWRSTTGSVNVKITIRTRLWIDGSLKVNNTTTVLDVAKGGRPSENQRLTYTQALNNPRYGSGFNVEYTYPAYKSTSVIKAEVTMTATFTNNGPGTVGWAINGDGANILVGDIFRLG